MTPQQIEALKLALGALEIEEAQTHYPSQFLLRAITAIKEVLAEHAMSEVQRLGQEIEQEPVAWQLRIGDSPDWGWLGAEWEADFYGKQSGLPYEKRPLYTAPPQRKPLTHDELADLWYKPVLDWMKFARAIEAAHDIKENT